MADHVVLPDDDQGGHRQRRKLVRRDVRMVDHQTQDLLLLTKVLRKGREQTAQVIFCHNRQLDKRTHPLRRKVCTVEDERAHPLRVGKRKGQRQIAAVRKAEQVSFGNVQGIHQPQQVLCKNRKIQLAATGARPSLPSGVHQHQTEAGGEGCNLSGKVAVVLTVAVQQDECLRVRVGRGVFQIKNLCVCALHKTAAWLHRASLLLRI